MAGVSVGIWGPRGSGKTTYLALLPYSKVSGKFIPADRETGKYLNDNLRQLIYGGEPVSTTTAPQRLVLDVSTPPRFLRNSESFVLKLADFNGEIAENPKAYKDEFDLINFFRTCPGISWFIDPDATSISTSIKHADVKFPRYAKMLTDTMHHLYEAVKRDGNLRKGRLPHYMAFCLTKMDRPQYYDAIKDSKVAELIQIILGPHWFKDVDRFCDINRCRAFPLSSFGLMKDNYGNFGSNFDGKRIIDPDHIDPFGIEEPIEWILENVAAYSAGKRGSSVPWRKFLTEEPEEKKKGGGKKRRKKGLLKKNKGGPKFTVDRKGRVKAGGRPRIK